jgi:recombination protein RecT
VSDAKAAIQKLNFKKPAPNVTALKAMGATIQGALTEAMPSFLRNQAPALLRALYTEVQKKPALLSCTPESLFACTIQAGQLGWMLGATLGQCYLIPFKGQATLIPGYKGYIQLANRSGLVGSMNAHTVYAGDVFEVTCGTDERIVHRPRRCETADEVSKRVATDFYATAKTAFGMQFAAITRAEAEYHRDRFALARNRNGEVFGPWIDHFESMAMKTCILKLCKFLPLSVEMQTAAGLDAAADSGQGVDCSFLFGGQEEDDDAPPPNKLDQLRARLSPTQQSSPVLDLLAELSEEGGDAAVARFFEAHNVTEDDLAIVKGKKADEYVTLLRAAVEEAKGVPA